MPFELNVKLGDDTFIASGEEMNDPLAQIFNAWVNGHDPDEAGEAVDAATGNLRTNTDVLEGSVAGHKRQTRGSRTVEDPPVSG